MLNNSFIWGSVSLTETFKRSLQCSVNYAKELSELQLSHQKCLTDLQAQKLDTQKAQLRSISLQQRFDELQDKFSAAQAQLKEKPKATIMHTNRDVLSLKLVETVQLTRSKLLVTPN